MQEAKKIKFNKSYGNAQNAVGWLDNIRILVMPWITAFGLPLLIVSLAMTKFKTAVVTSIKSTPHPELVYVILGVAAVALGLLIKQTYSAVSERKWLYITQRSQDDEQNRRLKKRSGNGPIDELYKSYVGIENRVGLERITSTEHAIEVADTGFLGRLALPNLLAGALVGLGLVGTFIGLLQTLDELSGVFSALGGANADQDAASLFTSMIAKLQGPMQGMGTAFVASLYGLMGSLVISISALTVRRNCERLFAEIRIYFDQKLRDCESGKEIAPLEAIKVQDQQNKNLLDSIEKANAKLENCISDWAGTFERSVDAINSTSAGHE